MESRTVTERNLPEPTDAELGLRRQLSRLQHQLADAQRELANKDDELAAAQEKRHQISTAYDALVEQQKRLRQQLDEALALRARMEGVDQRLQQTALRSDDLVHLLARERTERTALVHKLHDMTSSFESARASWKEESIILEERHAIEIAQLEEQKRAAIETVQQAMNATIERERAAHEAALAALRAGHERSLAAVRGELEPARNLAAERERLAAENRALRGEQVRKLAELGEQHRTDLERQIESHAIELSAQARAHAGELARMTDELAAKDDALVRARREVAARDELWETRIADLRESHAQVQAELLALQQQSAHADADKSSLEMKLLSAVQTMDKLTEDKRELRELLDAAEVQARNNALDRQRFVAYFEEGLAMLGAARSEDER